MDDTQVIDIMEAPDPTPSPKRSTSSLDLSAADRRAAYQGCRTPTMLMSPAAEERPAATGALVAAPIPVAETGEAFSPTDAEVGLCCLKDNGALDFWQLLD